MIETIDGRRDRVTCGDGDDVAHVDPIDFVTGCETTRRVRRGQRVSLGARRADVGSQ